MARAELASRQPNSTSTGPIDADPAPGAHPGAGAEADHELVVVLVAAPAQIPNDAGAPVHIGPTDEE
mgnify:FL=1